MPHLLVSFIAALSLLSLNAHGQNATFANTQMNKVYRALENPISITVEGYSWESISATTDNGTITKNDTGHIFTYIPAEPGTGNITVYSGGQKIAVHPFRVYTPPAPHARFMRQEGDSISMKRIKEAPGVTWRLLDFDYMVSYKLDGYTFTVNRGNKTLGSFANTGMPFNAGIKRLISIIQPGDKIVISNASVTYGSVHHNLEPLTVSVVAKGKWDDVVYEEWK
ncbi:MAG: hypothetical protein JNL72_14440 [Flavipsychrobacter sp.]|nr:hypothetical protein [Flavipsychrobacter sp.]